MGFRVIALSPDRPEKMVDSLKVKDLGYDLYSDQSMQAARAFGIAFQVDDDTLDRYKRFGIDLEAASNRDHNQLPVPSVFLVTKGGTIRWVYSNDDYTIRPDNEALLEAARRFGVKSDRAKSSPLLDGAESGTAREGKGTTIDRASPHSSE